MHSFYKEAQARAKKFGITNLVRNKSWLNKLEKPLVYYIPIRDSPSLTILALPKSPMQTRASWAKKQLLGLISP